MKELVINPNSRWTKIAKDGGLKLHRVHKYDSSGHYIDDHNEYEANVESVCDFRWRVFLGLLVNAFMICLAIGGGLFFIAAPSIVALERLAPDFLSSVHWIWAGFAIIGAGAMFWLVAITSILVLVVGTGKLKAMWRDHRDEKRAAAAAAEAELVASGKTVAKSMYRSWKDKVCTKVTFKRPEVPAEQK